MPLPLRDFKISGVYVLLMGTLALWTFQGMPQFLLYGDDSRLLDAINTAGETSFLYPLAGEHGWVSGRPTFDYIFLFFHKFWGDDPAPYHHLLVFLHLGASLCLAFAVAYFQRDRALGFLTGLLFLMNVAHFRAVHWISGGMPYPIGLILGLVSLVFYARFVKSRRSKDMVLSCALLFLALGNHAGSAWFVPLAVYFTWRKGHPIRKALRMTFPLIVLCLVASLLILRLYPKAPQSVGAEFFSSPESLKYFLWYLGTLVLTAHWHPLRPSPDPTLMIAGLGLIVLCTSALVLWRRKFPLADGLVAMILALLPFLYNLHVLSVTPSRYLYFSSAGASLALAALLLEVMGHARARLGSGGARLLVLAFLVGLLLFSKLSLDRTKAISFYLSGADYTNRGIYDLGVLQYERALSVDEWIVPEDVYHRLAIVSFCTGKSQRSRLEKVLKRDPTSPTLNVLLAIDNYLTTTSSEQENDARIREALERSHDKIQLLFDASVAYNNVAGYFFHQEEYKKAVPIYLKALKYRPGYTQTQYFLGLTYYRDGQPQRAKETLGTLLKRSPGYLPARNSLGVILFEEKRVEEAMIFMRRTIQLFPNDPHARENLLRALLINGNGQLASGECTQGVETFREAVAWAPTDAGAYRGLGRSLVCVGSIQEGIVAYRKAISFDKTDPQAQIELDRLLSKLSP